ncbi:response regulator [Polaribacter sp. MSW13]|uniref:Response regulator n=1 Tax=Polaribacter marinus TaxID=2916838 RepID=A0A9X1VMI2_9FLAO|nr:response regulator [Polaribacter marinus]MCI2229249.1 response regulator [Polaribacter marinus]
MNSLSILLIDDDEIERMKFRKVCEKNQFNHLVIEANDGEKAISLLNNPENSFDLIILDLNMPKMNGFEFLKKLKRDNEFQHIPVVIMSTSSSYSDLKACYSIGVAGYFSKPLYFNEYSNKIVSLLNYWEKNELIS